MKKALKRILTTALVLALTLATALPISAFPLRELPEMPDFPEIPTSFNFTLNQAFGLELSGDVPAEAILGAEMLDGFTLDISGTVYTTDTAIHTFTEYTINLEQFLNIPQIGDLSPMIALMGMDLNEPVRVWTYTNLSELTAPTVKMVVELPALIRLPLMFADNAFSAQYWVFDLSEIVEEAVEIFELEIRYIGEERAAEMWRETEEMLAETWEELLAELTELTELWEELIEELSQIFTLSAFEAGERKIENGRAAFLNIAFSMTQDGATVAMDYAFYGSITNINTAEKIPLPTLTATNSFDAMAFISDQLELTPLPARPEVIGW